MGLLHKDQPINGAPVNDQGHPMAAGLGTGAATAAIDHHHHEKHPESGSGHPLAAGAAVGGATAAIDHHHHNHHNAAVAPVGTTGHGTGVTHSEHIATQDPALMDQHANPLYPSPHAPGAEAAALGTGAGAGVGTHSGNLKTASGKSPSTQAFIGKVEHAVGTIVHSESLKAKGIAKEQEAIAIKNQSLETREAERLESQAGLARDRANQHAATGAMHSHQHGAVGYGAAPTNVGEIGQASQGIGGIGGGAATRAI